MKYVIETKKEVVIDLPEYPFYLKTINTNGINSITCIHIWVKSDVSATVCTFNQLYNDSPSKIFKTIVEMQYNFVEITKEQFEEQVKKTIDILTLIPFKNDRKR